MALFLVQVSSTAVVVADDAGHAFDVARSYVRDIVGDDGDHEVDVMREVTTVSDLEGGWDAMCIPYGGDGNTRTGELLSAASTAQPADAPALPPTA